MLIIHSIFTRNITVCVHSHCLRNKKMFLLEATLAHKKAPAVHSWPPLRYSISIYILYIHNKVSHDGNIHAA